MECLQPVLNQWEKNVKRSFLKDFVEFLSPFLFGLRKVTVIKWRLFRVSRRSPSQDSGYDADHIRMLRKNCTISPVDERCFYAPFAMDIWRSGLTGDGNAGAEN
jgi:hypothetical protein